jgi:YesN/AraC family two-component response regulator
MIKPEFIHPEARYAKSNLSQKDIESYAEKITRLMKQEKIFVNPDLNLQELSIQLELHPKYVSEIINVHFKQSFTSLVNYFRIKESKRLLTEDNDSSIKEICYDVGFSSRSAFNNMFRKYTGKSPSEFQDGLR